MSAGEYCTRDVVVVEKTESVQTAVDLMRSHHVGDVVVVEKRDDRSNPVGILTDRDIVLEILAEHVDLASVCIGDVMSSELHTVREDTKFLDAIKVMRRNGIRRRSRCKPNSLIAHHRSAWFYPRCCLCMRDGT